MVPESQANAVAGATSRRRALRAWTAKVATKPPSQPAATPSHGAAASVTTAVSTLTPHAARPRDGVAPVAQPHQIHEERGHERPHELPKLRRTRGQLLEPLLQQPAELRD